MRSSSPRFRNVARSCGAALCLALAGPASAETGYDLWLRYRPLSDAARLQAGRRHAAAIVRDGAPSDTARTAIAELQRGLSGLLHAQVQVVDRIADGAVLIATPAGSSALASLGWRGTLERLGADGYVIRSATLQGKNVTVIASAGEAGVLYGVFHFLRLLQTGRSLAAVNIAERPRLERRLLNHWDNLDGTIERGYAGQSLWWGRRRTATRTRTTRARMRRRDQRRRHQQCERESAG
jgi:alpha-glucuronidase